MTNKCRYTKEDGTACGAYAMTGQEFCYLHNPAIPEDHKKLAQAKGGTGRALTIKTEEALPDLPIATPDDAVLLLVDTIRRVRAGQLDVRIANCIGVLSGHLIKALEVAQLKDKVETIDRLILEKRTRQQ